MSILVVDNEPVVCELVCRALHGRGYHTLAASNAGDALALASREPPLELMVSETVLPGMSGVDLARAVVEKSPSTPILFMSAFKTDEVPPDAPFLEKPFTVQTLVSRVEAVLAQSVALRDQFRSEVARSGDLAQQARMLRRESREAREQAAEIRRRAQELRARNDRSGGKL